MAQARALQRLRTILEEVHGGTDDELVELLARALDEDAPAAPPADRIAALRAQVAAKSNGATVTSSTAARLRRHRSAQAARADGRGSRRPP